MKRDIGVGRGQESLNFNEPNMSPSPDHGQDSRPTNLKT